MPPKTDTTSTTTVAKFNSVLRTPVDTKLVDLTRASKWLANYLQESCPLYEQLVRTMVMNHMNAHRMPDPKVLQISLNHLALVPPDQVQRLMRKFWDMLLTEQTHELEKRVPKQKDCSPPKDSTGESRSDQDNARGRTSTPPPKRPSPQSEWDCEPKRARLDSHTPRPKESRLRSESDYSRRFSHTSSRDYDTYHRQYFDSVQHRPRAQHSGPSTSHARSYFV